MALALRKASKLKPEIRLAQAVSQFEADLSSQQKQDLHIYRHQMSKNPPNPSDVMRLTAQIDRLVSPKAGCRCFGPRLTSFLQAVQQFAALGDVIVGGSQNIIACGVWSILFVNFSSYLEKISALLMVAGRSAPRHQSIAVLYPRSTHLQSYLSEYYIVVVSLCHKLLRFTQKSTVGQLAFALGSLDINPYQSELEHWANAIKDEMSVLMAEKIEGEAQENWRFRALTTKVSASTSQSQRLNMNRLVLESLSKHDFEKTWKQTRKAGNTTLLNRNITYQDWKDREDSCTLVYTGKLGCGKSVLLANMVDDTNLHIQNKATLVAYFFTRHDIPESLKARTIIGSLAIQFLRIIPNLDLTSTAKSLDMTRPALDVESIFNLLQHTLPTDFKAYVILDGIDDCHHAEREELIQHLHELQIKFKLLLCISHRLESNSLLKRYLENFTAATSTSVPDNNPDIEEFIAAELESCIQSRKLVLGDPSLVLEIQDALQAGSKGMFLWTALQIESLCFMKTDDTIRQALRNLPKDLSETFSRILKRSRELGEPYQKRILELVTAAQRPLTAEEFGEAISVVPGDATWNPAKALNDVFSVLTCCGSLLIVDEEDFTIRLVHHSVKQFLLSGYKASEAAITIHGARRTMSEIVITYLNYSIFDTQLSPAHSSQIMSQSPMPDIVHSALGSSSTVPKLALRFLKSRKQPDFDMNKVLREARGGIGTNSNHQHHFRSYTRLYWVQHILDLSHLDPVMYPVMYRLLLRLFRGNEVHADTTDDFGRTPLSLAVLLGNEIVVRALLESGKAEVDSKDRYGQTPLSMVAETGNEAMVKLLLETGKVDINSIDSSGTSPLSRAVANGYKAVARLFLKTGKVNLEKGSSSNSLLSWVAMNGYKAVVELLLKTAKVDVNSTDSSGTSPLSRAVANGHKAVARLFLKTGKVDLKKGSSSDSLLSWAATNRHKAVVELLLKTAKVDVNSTDSSETSPLSRAAANGYKAVVRLFLKTGKVDLEKGSSSDSLLWWAAANRYKAVIKLLLKTGKVNVNTKDSSGYSPLSRAAANGHNAVVKLLLEMGKAEVGSKNIYGQTPLSLAAESGHEAVVRLLLETGKVNVNWDGFDRRSPLSLAAESGHKAVVRLLLETGKADVNCEANGRSPLSLAAGNGHEAVVKLLLETGKINSKSMTYRIALGQAKDHGGHNGVVTLLESYSQK